MKSGKYFVYSFNLESSLIRVCNIWNNFNHVIELKKTFQALHQWFGIAAFTIEHHF